jgi:hypothetical protein
MQSDASSKTVKPKATRPAIQLVKPNAAQPKTAVTNVQFATDRKEKDGKKLSKHELGRFTIAREEAKVRTARMHSRALSWSRAGFQAATASN